MNSSAPHWFVAWVVMTITASACAYMVLDIRSQAVEHGCAAYNTTTGKWGWK